MQGMNTSNQQTRRGRPPKYGERMKQVPLIITPTLLVAYQERAERLYEGSLSAAIRAALELSLEFYYRNELQESKS